jgi:iron complex transport system substrate-binding protein
VAAALDDLLAQHAGQHVLLVGHAGVMRMALAWALQIPLEHAYRIEVASATLTRLRFDWRACQPDLPRQYARRSVIRCLLLGLGLLLGGAAAGRRLRLVDDIGQTLELSRPPQRIISLTPHLTELAFAVGAGAQLVGADSASDFPHAARSLPRVGDYSRISFERILALKPDLVLVWVGGNRAADIHGLKKMGLPVLHTRGHPARRRGAPAAPDRAGERTRRGGGGRGAGVFRAAGRAAVRDGRQPPVSVFYQVWDRPLMTVGGSHWISDALALCGARNVFADLRGLAPVVSREAVLRRAPELIVGGSDAPGLRRQWQRFDGLPAVKKQAFVQVDADLLHRPTPRLVEGVAELCAAVAPYR